VTDAPGPTPAGAPDPAPTPEQLRLQRDYRPAFLRYLSRRDEPARLAGYELGRAAVADGSSLLDLVEAHHVTLLEVLPDARDAQEVVGMSTAASEFLTEVLAAFSMTSSAFPAMAAQLDEATREIARLRAQRDVAGEGTASS
jgi:Phosphoserine phosphatase RsbU, N-terminal domain